MTITRETRETATALPIVHLNGTGRDGLLDLYREAAFAVRGAMDKLALASPHGRDYYVSPDSTVYERARREHEARADRLRSVHDDLMALALHVGDAGR